MTKFTEKIYETTIYGNEKEFTGEKFERKDKMVEILSSLKKKPKTILDVGCGVGYFSNYLNSRYRSAKVYGVDISKKALNEGRKKYKNVKFIQADAEKKLPFKANTFDLVISGNHIEHLVDTDAYLAELNRVTKRGGTLILTTPNLGSWLNRTLLLFGRQPYFTEASLHRTLPVFQIGSYTFPNELNYPASGHLRIFTLDMLKKLLSVYGFEVTQEKGAMMLEKPLLYQLDKFFTYFPSLSLRLILEARKVKNVS